MVANKTAGEKPRAKPGDEPYDPDVFAKKYGIPPGEAKTIIKRYGPSRKKLDSYMEARNA